MSETGRCLAQDVSRDMKCIRGTENFPVPAFLRRSLWDLAKKVCPQGHGPTDPHRP